MNLVLCKNAKKKKNRLVAKYWIHGASWGWSADGNTCLKSAVLGMPNLLVGHTCPRIATVLLTFNCYLTQSGVI